MLGKWRALALRWAGQASDKHASYSPKLRNCPHSVLRLSPPGREEGRALGLLALMGKAHCLSIKATHRTQEGCTRGLAEEEGKGCRWKFRSRQV